MVQKIEAEGDLMIQYKGRVFVGSELEFDFNKKTGIFYDGKTFSSMWYVGGDQIQLNPGRKLQVTTPSSPPAKTKRAPGIYTREPSMSSKINT